MAKKRGFKDAKKGFDNRQNGIMKKANTLHRLTGAHIAILIEFNGTTYSYQSDTHFSAAVKDVVVNKQYGPDHFETVADRGGPQSPCRPDRQEETAAHVASCDSLTLCPSPLLPTLMRDPIMPRSGSSISPDASSSCSTSYTSAGTRATPPDPTASDFQCLSAKTQDSGGRARLRDPKYHRRSFYPLAADFF